MAHVPNPPLPAMTPFWGWYIQLDMIGRKFNRTGDDIASVWLIGPALASPFRLLAWMFYGARDKCGEAHHLVRKIQGWINGITEGQTFKQLFDNLLGSFNQLRSDPIGWVRDRLREVSADLFSIILNARAWIEGKIGSIYPFINQMRWDMRGWFRSTLIAYFPFVAIMETDIHGWFLGLMSTIFGAYYYILWNPFYYMIDAVRRNYPYFHNLVSNPMSEIVRLLKLYNPAFGEFLDNPHTWTKNRVINILGIMYDVGLGIPLSLLRTITYRIQIANTSQAAWVRAMFCNVIMKFM